MLVQFTFRNFRSFRDENSLTLAASSSKELLTTNTFNPKAPGTPPLLRSAAIYGPNASGKSNLIRALSRMQEIVVNSSIKGQRNSALKITPFALDSTSPGESTEFEVIFITQGVRYQYGFEATNNSIISEWLYAYPKGRAQSWIQRQYNSCKARYEWGSMDKLSGQKQLWQKSTRSNALFLSTAINLNSDQLKPIYDWFEDTLRIIPSGGVSPGFTMHQCKDEYEREKILAFLRAVDFDINGIEVVDEPLADRLPDEVFQSLKDRGEEVEERTVPLAKTIHKSSKGKQIVFDLRDDESDGTKQLFALAGPWLDTLANGYVLFVDELHQSLHPFLTKYLISTFHNTKFNPHNAQLVFTTHDTSIMTNELFRRDQIWFCDRQSDESTSLFPLSEFRPRKQENFERGYLKGRYGALPYFSEIQKSLLKKRL